jgi:predicted O-methyltransferase YrrM
MRRCADTLEAEMTAEEHELLLHVLRSERFAGPHLEIGTAAGGTLCAMMQCFAEGERPQFVSVDRMTYFPRQMEIIRSNLQRHGIDPEEVDFRVATSARAFREARRNNDRFDFQLIDGSHKVMAVAGDLRWTRLLNPGGIVCLHDYCPRFPGVWLTVNRFLRRHRNYAIVGHAGSLLAVRKQWSEGIEISPLDWAYSGAWYAPLQVHRKWCKWKQSHRPAA